MEWHLLLFLTHPLQQHQRRHRYHLSIHISAKKIAESKKKLLNKLFAFYNHLKIIIFCFLIKLFELRRTTITAYIAEIIGTIIHKGSIPNKQSRRILIYEKNHFLSI